MRMTETPTNPTLHNTQNNIGDNNLEVTRDMRDRNNEALKRFTEFSLYVLLLACLLIGMLATGQLLVRIQRDALIKNHNYIPNEKQETFKIKNNLEFWKKELENIQPSGFYSGNESYRLFISEGGDIFCNNSLTPIGKVGKMGQNDGETEYTKYLTDLFSRKQPFIVEFRKQTKSLLFYLNSEALLIDKIFLLNTTDFMGEILRKYYASSFKGFLYDLKDIVKSSLEKISLSNSVYKKRLEVFKYFLFLGAFNGFNLVLCEEYISIFGGRFQILLIGNFKEFLKELFTHESADEENIFDLKGSKLCLVGAFVDSIEFLHVFKKTNKDEATYLKYNFNRTNEETLKIKFLSVFGYGPLKKAVKIFGNLRDRVVSEYQYKWTEILKDNKGLGVEKNLNNEKGLKGIVEAYYNVNTGWEVFDEVELKDDMKDDIPVIVGSEGVSSNDI